MRGSCRSLARAIPATNGGPFRWLRPLDCVASARPHPSVQGARVEVEAPRSPDFSAAELLGMPVDRLEVDPQELGGLPRGQQLRTLVWSAASWRLLNARRNQISQDFQLISLQTRTWPAPSRVADLHVPDRRYGVVRQVRPGAFHRVHDPEAGLVAAVSRSL